MLKSVKYPVIALILTLLCSSCGGPKLSVADAQMARGEYFDAAQTYRKLYNKWTKREERDKRGMVAFKMGQCYMHLGQDARASAAFQNAIRYDYPDTLAQLYLAQSLHGEGKYAPAIKAYEEYLKLVPGNKLAANGLAGAKMGLYKKGHTRYVVKQPKLINSRRADFAPMFLPGDNTQLYYTTTNEHVKGKVKSDITGMKNSNIWFMHQNEQGVWQKPEAAEGELNNDQLDEGVASFSPDGQTMYLTVARRSESNPTSLEIYTSQRSDAKWSEPRKFDITADTLSNFAHPTVSPDGEFLYFTSDMPGGEGQYDIWRINLKEPAGSLENLGKDINTPGHEKFPYALTDSILIFASDGHPGYGGLDLFKATLTPQGSWKVVNMGTPINSSGDDFGITYEKPDVESGYLSSNRGDGRGYDHIYSFVLPDLKINISGWVLDREDEPIPNAVIRIVGNDGSNQKTVAKNDGSFTFPLHRGVSYAMMAGARGFLNAKQEFTADNAEEDAEYSIDFILSSLSKPNIVENIFYDYDKATLRPESKKALDELAEMLRDNPNITIEMASHTDRHGTEEYNMDLSMRRAKSVVDYLIDEGGIDKRRLQYQGYGKSRPKTVTKRINKAYPQFEEGQLLNEEFVNTLSPENQDAADQINRRTEFQVLSTDFDMF